MLRQVSSRNSRSRGSKVKKFMQAGLLAVVSVWLVFQLKNTYKEMPEEDEPGAHALSDGMGSSVGRMGLAGRRGLIPRKEEQRMDGPIEDEESEEVDMKMNRGGFELNAEKDEAEAEEVGASGDEGKKREHLQEDREKSFHGDNVASAVVHATPNKDQDAASRGPLEGNSSVGDDMPSSAVGHGDQGKERMPGEHPMNGTEGTGNHSGNATDGVGGSEMERSNSGDHNSTQLDMTDQLVNSTPELRNHTASSGDPALQARDQEAQETADALLNSGQYEDPNSDLALRRPTDDEMERDRLDRQYATLDIRRRRSIASGEELVYAD